MGCHLWISVTRRSGCPPGQEMRTLLHHNPALPPAMLPFIPVLLVVWGIFFFSLFWNKKIKGFLCGLMWGNNPTNDLPRGSLSSLPPRKEGAVWLSRTFGGLSAVPAHYLITSSPQALGLFFFFFFFGQTVSGPTRDPFCCVLFSWDHPTKQFWPEQAEMASRSIQSPLHLHFYSGETIPY